MKQKEAYGIAHQNIKGRKKTGQMLFWILFLALFIYQFVNSIVSSVNHAVALSYETPMAKNIIYEDEDGTLYEKLKDACKDMEHVTDICPYVYEIAADVEGLEERELAELAIHVCSDNYGEYLVKGELPKEKELLLPHYMFATENGNYVDGSRYIGKTLKVSITNFLDEETQVEYTVSGTYDNIYAVTGNNTALLNPVSAVSLYELTQIGIEQEQEQIKKEQEAEEGNVIYVLPEVNYFYTVVLDSRDHLETVRNEIYEKLELSGWEEMMSGNEIQETVLPFVSLICNGLIIILLIVVIVMTGITIGNDIRGRKKEMAMYLIQGYTKKNLSAILCMEYALRMVPVYVCSVVVTGIFLILANLGIDHYMSMEYQIMKMEVSVRALVTGVGIVLIVFAVAVYTIREQLKKIELLKEIKAEG